jgi:adenine-specific DNA-methyltransferase
MTIEKLGATTPDITKQNVARLAELFPECVTEGPEGTASDRGEPVIDWDLLKQALADHLVEGPQERYRLDWPGKRQALLTANAPIDKTLRPMREDSVDFDTTRNLFIEGDNLDALKLLQEAYLGKIKMIYIDPPYNTGKDFIFKDKFAATLEKYEVESGQRDDEGGRLVANPETNGRFHSDWLNMMYSRLKLARNFLREDGAIFVSIDRNEESNLRSMLDEIFGASSFVSSIAVINNMKGRNDAADVAIAHEHLLIYKRRGFSSRGIPLSEEQLKEYKHVDDDGEKYALRDLRKRGRPDRREDRPKMYFPIFFDPQTKEVSLERKSDKAVEIVPLRGDGSDGRWRWGKEMVRRNLAILHPRYSAKKERWDVDHRVYLNPSANPVEEDVEDDDDDNIQRTSKIKSFLWGGDISTDVASREYKELFPGLNPDYPKSPFYLEKLIHMGSAPGDVVLDFFAGASTTADALFRLAVYDGSRRFIMVQWPEEISEDRQELAETRKFCLDNGIPADIASLSRERIRRAGRKILEDHSELEGRLDVGFRAFRIDSGNIVDKRVEPHHASQEALAGMISHIKDDRTDEDLLFGALLRWGVDVTLPIRKGALAGRTVWFVDPPADGDEGAAVIACFARPQNGKGGIDTELADAIAVQKPLRTLFRDDGFANDAAKENVASRFKQLAPDTTLRVL